MPRESGNRCCRPGCSPRTAMPAADRQAHSLRVPEADLAMARRESRSHWVFPFTFHFCPNIVKVLEDDRRSRTFGRDWSEDTQPHRRVAGKVLGFFRVIRRMNSPAAMEAHTDARLFDRTVWLTGSERRRNPRVPLHWTLYLACKGSGHLVRTTTRDINKNGFYCLLDQPLSPGEQIECDIVVPVHRSQDPDDVVYLRCRAQAVRVEKIGGTSEFGVACQIEDYCLICGASPQLQYREKGRSSVSGLPVPA